MLGSQYFYWFGKELKVHAYDSLSIAAVATGLTAGKLVVAGYEDSIRVWVTVEDADVRYRLDGSDPTASVGHRVYDGGTLEVEGMTNLSRLKFIAVSGTAKVSISYARYE